MATEWGSRRPGPIAQQDETSSAAYLLLTRFRFTAETGAPEGIRTPDLCLRRAGLYPAELRARRGFMYRRLREAAIAGFLKREGANLQRQRGRGSNPFGRVSADCVPKVGSHEKIIGCKWSLAGLALALSPAPSRGP